MVRSTSSNAVILCLDKIFSDYGIPESTRSNNGPPLKVTSFNEFASTWVSLTEKLPLTGPGLTVSGEVFMRTVKKVDKASVMENKVWKKKCQIFDELQSYSSHVNQNPTSPLHCLAVQ